MRTTCRRVSDGQTREGAANGDICDGGHRDQFIIPHRIRGRRGGSRSTDCVIRRFLAGERLALPGGDCCFGCLYRFPSLPLKW